MTTPIVQSVTDEQLAEIDVQRYDCTSGGSRFCQGCYTMSESTHGDYVSAEDYARLISRLRDAEAMLKFVLDEEITIAKMNGTGSPMVYQCQWHDCRQVDWYPSPIESVKAAMERQP
jgi:hypothetical protein